MIVNRSPLALFGGKPCFDRIVPLFNTIGHEEIEVVTQVLLSGMLSKYVGAPGDDFMGGPRVREMEKTYAEFFNVKHAIAVNSWTSGLIAAVGALGLEPGDEVIVSPWTMSASAMAILHWNLIPVFADIHGEDFCLDPEEIKKKLTSRTKAIMAIDIFGLSSNMEAYRKIAKEFNLKIISDSAQSPGAKYKGKFAGTNADIGGISLNYHKHIHSGEGGVIFTNDETYARKVSLIRNHAESVVTNEESLAYPNMIGFNFRLGEIEAAIATVQLSKLSRIIEKKIILANELTQLLRNLPGIKLPKISSSNSNVFYVYPITLDLTELKVSRNQIVTALRAEGVPGLMEGYQNLHLLPIFQNKNAFGSNQWPWSINKNQKYDYSLGSCPIAEELHSNTFLGLAITGLDFDSADMVSIATAFEKVWNHLDDLR